MEKVQISHIQLFMLLSGFLFGSTVIISPVQEAANDGWLAILLGGAGGFLLMWLYVKIALLNPSKTLVEILKERMGKVVGNILAVFYIWYFIHVASIVFRDFGEFITALTFPETPMGVIIGIFAVLVVYVLNSGIEVLARLCEILVPIIYTAILIISLALITVRDFTAFLPFLENGITPGFFHYIFSFRGSGCFPNGVSDFVQRGKVEKSCVFSDDSSDSYCTDCLFQGFICFGKRFDQTHKLCSSFDNTDFAMV
mgnify:CR=1 FL=1